MEKLEYYSKQYDLTLNGNKWEIDDPKAIIFLVTGMAEHSARYNHFATFLNEKGYSVYCLDHSGQGDNGALGRPIEDYFSKEIEIFNDFILDLKAKNNREINMFSHSMGSFVTQGYIEKYSKNISRVVLCGTNGRNPLVKIGKALSSMMVTKKNRDKDAKLLHNLSIGAYEKTTKKEGKNAWISYSTDNVKIYEEDEKSGYRCSNGFFKEFMKGLSSIQKSKNIKKISKDLKIFIVGGDSDPVGNNGKGLTKLYNLYKKYDLNVKLKIYQNMRHEILNEKDNLKVYKDILDFYEDTYNE